ncbi:MAG: hypothetical protein ABID87_09735 [Chloroflexota bacterium]
MNMLIVYLMLAVAVIGTGLMLMAFTYPELFGRFFRYLFRSLTRSAGQTALTPQQEEAKAKARKYIPLSHRIEQLMLGESLNFILSSPETWGGKYLVVQINQQYPQRGKKYVLSLVNDLKDLPIEERDVLYTSDQTLEIAASIMDRNGELLVTAEKKTVSAQKVAAGVKG